MKTYMPLNGLRWSRNSGSANCDMPQSAVFGRPGGGIVCCASIESFDKKKGVLVIKVVTQGLIGASGGIERYKLVK